MVIELSEEDLQSIGSWYYSAAGESATDRDSHMFELLDRLGIEAHHMDIYYPDTTHFVESHQPVVKEHIAAMKAYRMRHPELEVVQDAERDQPTGDR